MATREREKAAKRKEQKDTRPYAIAKHIRIASSKVKIVLDLIRGKSYADAHAILKTTNKSACEPTLKLLESAGANAENNMNIAKDTTYVAECWVTVGPTLKRMMPRARGSANRILKRTCHITIILDVKEGAVSAKRAATKATTKKIEQPAKKETVKTEPKKVAAKPAVAKVATKPAVKKESK